MTKISDQIVSIQRALVKASPRITLTPQNQLLLDGKQLGRTLAIYQKALSNFGSEVVVLEFGFLLGRIVDEIPDLFPLVAPDMRRLGTHLSWPDQQDEWKEIWK